MSDRIAQTVAKSVLEPELEKVFHDDSMDTGQVKSAHDAIEVTRKRCWQYPWIVEFDIKELFDNINHQLLMKALRKHCSIEWLLLYVERWLKISIVMPGGELREREKGTPQGGVISPLLANLFLHHVFDKWVEKELPGIPFCRYASAITIVFSIKHAAAQPWPVI